MERSLAIASPCPNTSISLLQCSLVRSCTALAEVVVSPPSTGSTYRLWQRHCARDDHLPARKLAPSDRAASYPGSLDHARATATSKTSPPKPRVSDDYPLYLASLVWVSVGCDGL